MKTVPREAVEQRGASCDEQRAEYECAEHAPEQHPVLQRGRYCEVREEQREDEDVVDREALLDQVARVVLRRCITAVPRPHDQPEREPDGDPDPARDRGLTDRYLVGVLVKDE
jgi:hypothetical protein